MRSLQLEAIDGFAVAIKKHEAIRAYGYGVAHHPQHPDDESLGDQTEAINHGLPIERALSRRNIGRQQAPASPELPDRCASSSCISSVLQRGATTACFSTPQPLCADKRARTNSAPHSLASRISLILRRSPRSDRFTVNLAGCPAGSLQWYGKP